jgi:hypothetical protein
MGEMEVRNLRPPEQGAGDDPNHGGRGNGGPLR